MITPLELHTPYCNFTETFSTPKYQMSSSLSFLWSFWTFKLVQGQPSLNSSRITCIVFVTYRDVVHIKISDEFDVDHYLTFMNFQTSLKVKWVADGNTLWTYDNSSEMTCIRISDEFNHCLTFITLQTSWRSNCLFNAIAHVVLVTVKKIRIHFVWPFDKGPTYQHKACDLPINVRPVTHLST